MSPSATASASPPRHASPALASRPLSEHVGVDVLDTTVQDVLADRWLQLQLKDFLAQHFVVRLRGQDYTPREIVSLGQVFGPLMDVRHAGNGARHVPEEPFIKVISNARDREGRRVGDGNSAGQIWHSDVSYWEAPPGVTLFCGRVAPPSLPKTHFMHMAKVYAALPESLRDGIRTVRIQHHQYPRGVEIGDNPTHESLPFERRTSGATHPLVRRHLGSNQPVLFLPYRRDSVIPGMSEDDSRSLLERLWDFVERTPYAHGVALEPGDVVIWDNAGTLHRRDAWPRQEARVMWHVSAQGEVPTPMFTSTPKNLNAMGFDGRGDRAYIDALDAVLP